MTDTDERCSRCDDASNLCLKKVNQIKSVYNYSISFRNKQMCSVLLWKVLFTFPGGKLSTEGPLYSENSVSVRKGIKTVGLMASRTLQSTWDPPFVLLPWSFDWQLRCCNCVIPLPVEAALTLGVWRHLQREGRSVTKPALCAILPGTSQDNCTIHFPRSSAKLQMLPLWEVTVTRDVVEGKFAKMPVQTAQFIHE